MQSPANLSSPTNLQSPTDLSSPALPARGHRRLEGVLVLAAPLVALVLALLAATSVATLANTSRQFAQAPRHPNGAQPAQVLPAATWPTYAGNNARQGDNPPIPSTLSPTNAASLAQLWALQSAMISDEPVIANGMVYWGDWGGSVHAATLDGKLVWSRDLGLAHGQGCHMTPVGVAGTPAIATVNGRSLLFIGGGTAAFYALDAGTGRIVWKTQLGAPPATFIWASPAIYNGSVYIPTSSLGDCPLIHAKVFRLNVATGAVQSTFATTPDGCTGASIWGSPAIDEASGTVYVATGNGGSCSQPEPYAEAILALRASDLHLLSYWQVPPKDALGDSDFGATPTLFDAGGRHLLGEGNKNGVYYVLDRQHLNRGPVWQEPLATGELLGVSSFTGSHLLVGGGNAQIGRQSCLGTLRALNPANGQVLWSDCLDGMTYGPVVATNGIVAISSGRHLYVVRESDGQILYSFDGGPKDGFFGGPTILGGRVYVGDTQGKLHCFG